MFTISETPLDPAALRAEALDPACGAISTFEGLVRNHNEGLTVESLEYSCHPTLAQKEGQRIVEEALAKFDVVHAVCSHRIGHLAIGEAAVIVHVSSHHRAAAFDACRYLIDEVKSRVPIWKREHFPDGKSEWLGTCEGCRQH